ncbi:MULTISPECIES: ArsR/SmtB family transcription factor [Paenibacillus]|uniref:ArsR/SmtB family transcription factor n=1 Tax=Paenibacillus TaxID=44249 RepID=UPI0011A8250C|nr:metalloregulator ArsR/SmtB family transcription factor [Paenibacillus sp. IHBB 10380]
MPVEAPNIDVTTLKALAEPNRLAIIELLRESPLTVGEISHLIKLSQPHTSKHLKVLSDCGIVKVHAKANRRYYKLRPEPFQSLESWIKSFQGIMEERFDNLDRLLKELKNEGEF